MPNTPPRERVITATRKVRLVEKSCAHCGQPFFGRSFQRFCSQLCKRRADYAAHAERRRAARREKYRRERPSND